MQLSSSTLVLRVLLLQAHLGHAHVEQLTAETSALTADHQDLLLVGHVLAEQQTLVISALTAAKQELNL